MCDPIKIFVTLKTFWNYSIGLPCWRPLTLILCVTSYQEPYRTYWKKHILSIINIYVEEHITYLFRYLLPTDESFVNCNNLWTFSSRIRTRTYVDYIHKYFSWYYIGIGRSSLFADTQIADTFADTFCHPSFSFFLFLPVFNVTNLVLLFIWYFFLYFVRSSFFFSKFTYFFIFFIFCPFRSIFS